MTWGQRALLLLAACPFLALMVRRLHDTGRSGWWVLLGLPLLGFSLWEAVCPLSATGSRHRRSTSCRCWLRLALAMTGVVLLALLLWDDEEADNRYGPNPALRPARGDRLSFGLPAPCDGAGAGGKCRGEARHPRLILATCILASSLAFIDGSVLNVALPAIGRSFGAATAEVQWVINAFTLPLTALLLLGGAAGDLYGRRRVMLWGIVLFTAASVLCAAAPSLEIFLAGRALQGVGAALLMPNSLATLSASFTGEKRGQAVGTWAAVGAISGALAPMLGGWLVDGIGWPFIFLLNVPIAAAAILLGWLYVPESENKDRPDPDWAGAALATAGLGALTWGLTAWSATHRLGGTAGLALGAGVLLLAAFLWVEHRRKAQAMVPLAMFGSLPFVGLTLFTFLLYGALGGLMLLLPYVLIEAAHYPATMAGAALLPLPIVIALGSPLMGRARRPDRPALAAHPRPPARRRPASRWRSASARTGATGPRCCPRSSPSRPAWRSPSRRSPPPCSPRSRKAMSAPPRASTAPSPAAAA